MDTVQAMKDRDSATEIAILRQKLDEANAKLELVGGALIETVWKMHETMGRLLAANDVNRGRIGFDQMRNNILENMNDMGRNVVGFFTNKNVVTFTVKDVWPPVGKHASHR